ncbi:hypothetical protein [Streptomyces nanshensis]|uniref:Uncharacterized protein n=1 Tax=Streptomyces nanshensis TaxID=518642 RepID=A0A1E7LCX1_9ACTN|nr:hypothetical protein [Streptomyces nanshensis]OEV13813.1 hypothetical protein AN218_01900 [Streptomyces nanshensis]
MSAIAPAATYEVRLDEPVPYSYVVTTKRGVAGCDVPTVARQLMNEDAVRHAAQWADFPGYVPARYQVKVFDADGQRVQL